MDNLPIILNVFGLMALVFIILGTAFLIIGTVIRNNSKDWDKTMGIIVNGNAIFKSLPNSYPTAKYTVEGIEYTHTSNIKQNPRIRTGKKVEILYNPDKPNQARINTAVQNGKVFKIIGTIFLSVSILPIIIVVLLLIILK